MKSTARSLLRTLVAAGSLAIGCGDGTSSTTPGSGPSTSTTGGGSSGGGSSGATMNSSAGMSASGNSGGGGSGDSGAGGGASSGDTGGSSAVDPAGSSSTTSAADGDGGTGGGGGSSGSGSSGSAGDDGGVDEGGDATLDGAGPSDASPGVVGDASKPITVWLAGDSTMQPCANPCPCGWGSQFQSYLSSKATVVDLGAGGRSIQTWLYDPNVSATVGANGECVVNPKTYSARWQQMLDPTSGMKPGDYLFIEFGINDTAPCPRHVGSALFETYLGIMAKAAKDRGAQPIFLTSTSAIICNGNTVAPDDRAFGPETRAAGMADGVPVIELTRLTAALYDSLGFCPNDGNYMSTTTALGKFFCDDHTHFEAAGAAQVAGVVAKALRDQNIGLAAYLK